MLPITGYVDRWSAKPGETLRFMISMAGGGHYRARVGRILCGDPNPSGPGFREVAMPSGLDGEHRGSEQPIRLGSSVAVPAIDLGPMRGPRAFVATIWPTRLEAGRQAVLHWRGADATVALTLGISPHGAFCSLADASGTVELALETGLTERRWYDIACCIDPQRGVLELGQAPRRARLDRPEQGHASVDLPGDAMPSGLGVARIAAEQDPTSGTAHHHFNGKIEGPRILRIGSVTEALAQQAAGSAPPAGTVVADWDLSVGIPTTMVADAGPSAWHGRCVNLPTRAATGSRWTGNHHRWTEAPAEYGAIHFHEDDIGDAGWQPTLELTIPEDWPSGVYALHLETIDGPAPGARDNIVFYVRAREPGRRARVAFLAPTITYTVYSQFVRPGRQSQIAPRAAVWRALPHAPDGHPEYGLSPYNYHSDGSGVAFATMRRPMIDKRVGQFHLIDPSPEGSGTYWITADSYITDLLDRRGIDFEVITDHDVQAEGASLLSRYQVVLTGQHPEYHTTETLDPIGDYLAGGGRLLYLGGNGFYWKVVPAPDGPWAFEVRRAEGGIRIWGTEPGEGYHAFDGSYGGLWRRLGRPPQALVGVGFSTQGIYRGHPYGFRDSILDPRVAFMRHGIEAAAQPGRPLGERGLMGGGAAGHELDRADLRLGTPPHALVVARAVLDDPTYEPVNEERLDQTWPGTREDLIRSDITFFETPNGGAVFSVGSMNFIGALPVDGYDNTAARLVENVVRRFADPEPFPPPAG
jgi:N,N-dimethylformamidase